MTGSKELSRFNFTPGPRRACCIEKGLWLGNLTAALDKKFLASIKCNHILTLDCCPLPERITSLPGMATMYIRMTDMPHEDIISNFDNTYRFIRESQKSGVVLVHCYFGVSRGAAVVIAFLMKKYCISFAQAFERVRAKQLTVTPNSGFIDQIRLYERMGYKIKRTRLIWRIFRMRIASEYVAKVNMLPSICYDVIKPDPLSQKFDPHVFRCSYCRRIIANNSNIIRHIAGKKVSWTDPHSFSTKNVFIHCDEYLFSEPLAWMYLNSLKGTLYCPGCRIKLGYFDWVQGIKCVCQAKMIPCFCFIAAAVDLSTPYPLVDLPM